MTLETLAMHWLAYEKKCHAVIRERSPRYGIGSPDILGITKLRFLTEVEIKRSVSDFKINAEKRHIINRHLFLDLCPRQFYFLVPESIMAKVSPLVPEWAGFAYARDDRFFHVLKNAPVNLQSKRLSVKECIALVRCMSNQIIAQAKLLDKSISQLPETSDYSI